MFALMSMIKVSHSQLLFLSKATLPFCSKQFLQTTIGGEIMRYLRESVLGGLLEPRWLILRGFHYVKSLVHSLLRFLVALLRRWLSKSDLAARTASRVVGSGIIRNSRAPKLVLHDLTKVASRGEVFAPAWIGSSHTWDVHSDFWRLDINWIFFVLNLLQGTWDCTWNLKIAGVNQLASQNLRQTL